MTDKRTPRMRVPSPAARPGDEPRFDNLMLAKAGEVRCPALDVDFAGIKDLAFTLIRVLDDESRPVGPWAEFIADIATDELLREGLRHMMITRTVDRRMLTAQRQGKTTNYAQATGEEAVACGFQAMLSQGDMNFPTYRQQGLLFASGYPLVSFMSQLFGNEKDPLGGRQLAVMHSARDNGFFTISGNLATQYIQAVGWAMGSAMSGDDKISAGWIGEGATAEGDFHSAMIFSAVYRPPVVLNIVNNQWAISTFAGIAGGEDAPFAARAHGYGLPSIRVDGNDFLAVLAASRWAIERARSGHGPTVIEWLTYRVAAHSTSDEPALYRPKNAGAAWPLGDPIDRLKRHLIVRGVWSEERHKQAESEIEDEVRDAQKEAEAHGTMLGGGAPPLSTLFDGIYKDTPEHIRRQRQRAGI